jgi:hypothetical protein
MSDQENDRKNDQGNDRKNDQKNDQEPEDALQAVFDMASKNASEDLRQFMEQLSEEDPVQEILMTLMAEATYHRHLLGVVLGHLFVQARHVEDQRVQNLSDRQLVAKLRRVSKQTG